MSFGKRKGWSDCIRGNSARNLLAAQDYALTIGRGLNTAVDINWSRTTARDDTHGALLRAWRKAAGRFLRERGAGGLTCTWVRERPTGVTPRPNTHINCHIPDHLFDAFVKNAHSFFPAGCAACDADAIFITPVGTSGTYYERRREYYLKGVHPRARLPIKRKRNAQGRVLRKRCGFSEDIGPTARERTEATSRAVVASIPF
jgi:hypothetical protein